MGSIFLALARALGETMAVTMVIGNKNSIQASLLSPGYSISAVIANEFSEADSAIYLSALIALGFVLRYALGSTSVSPEMRVLLTTGFLGGYTTFSSYTFEAVALVQDGRWEAALVYVVGSNVLGLLACFLGIVIARALGA